MTLRNTGDWVGQEVVQLYVSFPSDVPLDTGHDDRGSPSMVDFPVKVLRAFDKVELQPGETKVVTLRLTRRDLSYWNVYHQNWIMPTEGRFKIHVGNSSRHLPLVAEI